MMTTRDHDRYRKRITAIKEYFGGVPRHANLSPLLDVFCAAPCLTTAVALLKEFFANHVPGDVESLRKVTATFGHKSVVLALVDEILADPKLLAEIAARSYPHPIGFDKLVLYQHPSGFKLRLHVYWRSPQEVKTELIHLHKFEMASSPITGELDNRIYRVIDSATKLLRVHQGDEWGPNETFHAYTGYERDASGALHKRYLGEVLLEHCGAETYYPGQTYAQPVSDAHYVMTNAETGHVNNDVCSTIYIHGPGLDDGGRRIPVLFEPERLAEDDRIVPVIPCLAPEKLRASLGRYRELLAESVRFYEWLYDPKHGPNLSAGLVAGYLLAEAFGTPEVLRAWDENERACRRMLDFYAHRLEDRIRWDGTFSGDERTDPERRYLAQLDYKARHHAQGKAAWLDAYGDLSEQFRRYRQALIDDYAANKGLRELKPIWGMQTLNVRGGVHWGNVRALLHAARSVEPLLRTAFEAGGIEARQTPTGPTTTWDAEAQRIIKDELAKDMPEVRFAGEENGEALSAHPAEGERSWLVDPIDGTRNFIAGSRNFAVSAAHVRFEGGAWKTTDAVVSLPVLDETYWAERGEGSYCIRHGVQRKLTRVTARDEALPVRQSIVELPTIRGFGRREQRLRDNLGALGVAQRSTGCTALSLCQVAAGQAQAVIVTTNPYDVAAGLLVAEEAGAYVASGRFFEGGRIVTVYAIARSKKLHEALQNAIDEVVHADAAG